MNADLATFITILQCVQTTPTLPGQLRVVECGARLAADIMTVYGAQPANLALPAGIPGTVQALQVQCRGVSLNWPWVAQLVLHATKQVLAVACNPPVNYVK